MTADNARETALKVLYQVNEKGAYSNISLGKYLDESSLKSIDRAFATELVYGTIKWMLTIDWMIESYSNLKLGKVSQWIINILRLGVYQLLFMDRIPVSAACNESVKLARKYGHEGSVRFVNGLLRNVARNRDSIKYPDRSIDPVKYLSVRYSHPEWLVKEWLGRFGEQFSEALLDSNNSIPELSLRVNTLKITPDDLISRLEALGASARKSEDLDECIFVSGIPPISELEEYRQGLFQVQDPSSMLAVKVLDPRPGELAVDVCSAPGGKATHMAQLMQNRGTVVARDIYKHKLKLVEDAARRLGCSIINTQLYDAAIVDESLSRKADKVLVDAPCTGFGILRRKPEIRWVRSPADRAGITEIQHKVLKASASYVRPGGILVYSTCTIEKEENQEAVQKFLAENEDFAPVDITGKLPRRLAKDTAPDGYIQLYPNVDGMDGFFISRLQRRSE